MRSLLYVGLRFGSCCLLHIVPRSVYKVSRPPFVFLPAGFAGLSRIRSSVGFNV